ncbi:hypothetical protein EE612_002665, partial [Oryza sativa]
MRVRIKQRRARGRHEVEREGEVVQVREAEEIPGEVPAPRQPRLVRLEHLLQLLQALVNHLLVGRDPAHDGEDDALEHDGRQCRVVLVRLDLRPYVHQRGLPDVALPEEIDFARLVLAKNLIHTYEKLLKKTAGEIQLRFARRALGCSARRRGSRRSLARSRRRPPPGRPAPATRSSRWPGQTPSPATCL